MVFLVFVLPAFTQNIFGQEFYKWVDEKGTVHFSDNPTYARNQQQKEYSKENGIEVLKKAESNDRPVMDRSGKRIIINYSQGASPGIGSYAGGGTTYSSGTS
jgi:tRNA G46 methylase TrmB